MTKNETAEREASSTCSSPAEQDAATSNRSDEERFGRDPLIEGLIIVIQRGRLLACMPLLPMWEVDDDGNLMLDEDRKKIMHAEIKAMAEAWYEAVLDVIPCHFWKDVGLYASRYTKPVDKFTLGQFFEAWRMYCEQGKARGYESWR